MVRLDQHSFWQGAEIFGPGYYDVMWAESLVQLRDHANKAHGDVLWSSHGKMNQNEYIQKVQHVLDEHTERAASELAAALAVVPAKAQQVTLDIFVDQDGEGFLTVRVGLDGPDLDVLNRAIAPHADLFRTQLSEQGLEPNLPQMSPRRSEFSVHDTLTDCAAGWLQTVWTRANYSGVRIPVVINSPDGYGAKVPCQLSP